MNPEAVDVTNRRDRLADAAPAAYGAPARSQGQDMTDTPNDVESITYRQPYEAIPRAVLQDYTISDHARGLLVRMLSMPDGWAFSAERLCRPPEGVRDAHDAREGRAATQARLAELTRAGYYRTQRHQRPRGSTTDRGGTFYTTTELTDRPHTWTSA